MGFFHSIGKLVHKAMPFIDPGNTILHNQGGALGSIGDAFNPGISAADKIAHGAPINTRTLVDPNNWAIPPPIAPEVPGAPLPSIGSIGPLPQGLQRRAVPYSQPPPNAGALTQLAYRMAGPPPPNPPGATPFNPPPPMSGVPGGIDQRIGLQPMPSQMNALGLPMTDPLDLARLRMYTQ